MTIICVKDGVIAADGGPAGQSALANFQFRGFS